VTSQQAVYDNEESRPQRHPAQTDVVHPYMCPRCRGAVLEFGSPRDGEIAVCVNCGWRDVDIPEDVLAEVRGILEKRTIEGPYARR
jgi:hypothetical protein